MSIDLGPCFQYSVDAIMVFDDNCTVMEANQAACELLNIPYAKLVKQQIWKFLTRDYRAEAVIRWTNFMASGKQDGLFLATAQENQLHYYRYRLTANVVNEKYHLGIFQDVSERVDVAIELAASEERYRRLNSIYPVGIFHADKDGKDVYVNEKACEIMGLTFDECMGNGWQKNLHPDDYDKVVNGWLSSIHNRGYFNLEYRFIQPNGRVRWVHAQSVPEYDRHGNITHFVGTLTDITQLHNAEQEASRAQAELAKVSRLNAIGEMASGIAHELNQPLTAISNYANGCKRRFENTDIDPKIMHTVIQIAKQAERAGEIIHHLKDFLRHGELQKKTENINKLVQETINFMETSFEHNNIVTFIKFDNNIPPLLIDSINIQQVIVNIVTNAIDAINEAKPRSRYIKISSALLDTHCSIRIADSGPGVPLNLRSKIFTPFFTTKESGTGIGLALSHTIIQRHGGELKVCNDHEHASCFEILLPIDRKEILVG